MNTGIFRMVSGSQLAFCLRQVERTAVRFGSTGYDINQKRYYSRNMPCEYKPCVFLRHTNVGYRHRSGKNNHGYYRQSQRQFVAYHLGSRTQRTDKGELVVRRPSGQQYAQHAYRRNCQKEEYAYIKVYHLYSVTPGKHGKAEHRCYNYQIWSQRKKEFVDMV